MEANTAMSALNKVDGENIDTTKRRRMTSPVNNPINEVVPTVTLTVIQQPGTQQPSSVSLFVSSASSTNPSFPVGSSSGGNGSGGFFSSLPTFSKHTSITNDPMYGDVDDEEDGMECDGEGEGEYYEVEEEGDDDVVSALSDSDPLTPRASLDSNSGDVMELDEEVVIGASSANQPRKGSTNSKQGKRSHQVANQQEEQESMNGDNDNSNEPNASGNGGKVVTKRRIYHRRANPFPRVLKRDIRRDYGAMLVNVMNSFDGDLTSKFFNQFCVQNCHKLDLFPEVTKHYNLPGFRHVDGLNKIVYHLLHDLSHIPDSVFRIKGSHIRQRSDIQGSQVCVRVLFQGTKIYTNQSCNVQNLLSTMEAALQQQQGGSGGNSLTTAAAAAGMSGLLSDSNTLVDTGITDTTAAVGATTATTGSNEEDVDDNQSVVSALSTSTNLTSSSVLPSGRSLWMPVPPELDEKELNALDIQTLHRHLKSFAMKQQELSSIAGSVSHSEPSTPISTKGGGMIGTPIPSEVGGQAISTTANSLSTTLASLGLPTPPIFQQQPDDAHHSSPLSSNNKKSAITGDDEDISGVDLDITKEEWYENRGITLLPKPFQITVDGTIIMHLDEEHRIHRLEFVSSSLLADMRDTPGFGTTTSSSGNTGSDLQDNMASLAAGAAAAMAAAMSSSATQSNQVSGGGVGAGAGAGVDSTAGSGVTTGAKTKKVKSSNNPAADAAAAAAAAAVAAAKAMMTFPLPGIANPHLGGGKGKGKSNKGNKSANSSSANGSGSNEIKTSSNSGKGSTTGSKIIKAAAAMSGMSTGLAGIGLGAIGGLLGGNGNNTINTINNIGNMNNINNINLNMAMNMNMNMSMPSGGVGTHIDGGSSSGSNK